MQEKEEVGQKEKQKTRVQPERSKKHVPRRKAEALTENISGIIRVYVHMYVKGEQKWCNPQTSS